jgi:DNA-binding transcriptional ArsR family regulator
MEFGVSIVVVHHVRKSNADTVDPIEKVSGTLGLSGAADTIIVLDSSSRGFSLCGRGRDIQEFETDVKFDPARFRWIANGPVAEVRISDTRKAILESLAFAPEPASPKEIATGTGLSDNVVRQHLGKLVEAGEVLKVGRAQYILPGNKWYTPDSPETPSDPDAGGHNKHNNRNNEEQ